MGQGALTALAQIAADSLGLEIDQVTLRFGDSDLPDGGVAGGSAIRRPPARPSTRPAGTPSPGSPNSPRPTAARRSSARAMSGSSRAADGSAARTTRAAASAMRHPRPRRPGGDRRMGQGRARSGGRRRPCACSARSGLRGGQGRPRSRPGPRDPPRRRLHSRADHQPAARAEPALWRHDLGPVFRAARRGERGSAERPDHECRPRRIPRAGERGRALARSAAGSRGRRLVNGLGVKGVGEIGITGTVGAIANAVWHATGVRVREFPIRIEHIMTPLSAQHAP